MQIASWYVENESGARLDRPELSRLLADSDPGDILLVEQVDRLSRLKAEDWESLKVQLGARKIRVVALDLPTSWIMATTGKPDDFTGRAINGMPEIEGQVRSGAARGLPGRSAPSPVAPANIRRAGHSGP